MSPFLQNTPKNAHMPLMARIGPDWTGKLLLNELKWLKTQVAVNKTLTKLFVLDYSRFFLQVVLAIAFFFLHCWLECGVPIKKRKTDDALHHSLPFVQYKKREKDPWRSASFSKVAKSLPKSLQLYWK